jgi:DNA-binding SARP family transcriptional activator
MSAHRLIGSERFPGRQGRLVFAHLATQHGRPVSRDELVEALWSSSVPLAYEVALSALISKLRALLASAGAGREALIAAARCYELRLPGGSWVDIDAAAEAVHTAESCLRSALHKKAYGPAVVAGAILRRPFLPGVDSVWVEEQRRHLLALRLRALDCLVEIHSWNREPTLALTVAEEAVTLEPYRESGYRMLMRIHRLAGNPAEALRVYDRLCRLLAADLGTRPALETKRLSEELGRATAEVTPSRQ